MKKKASEILPSGSHIFIILVILAALGITVAMLVPGAAMSASPDPSGNDIANEVSFRQAFGFNSDEGYVQSVDAQYPIDSNYGIHLTPEISLSLSGLACGTRKR